MYQFMKGVGIDLVEVDRFIQLLKKDDALFFEKYFTEYERGYCFAFKDSAPHFAGLFAAKEATSKALGVYKFPVMTIEIKHNQEGMPIAYFGQEKLPVQLSISHTSSIAAAIAVA